MRGSVQVYGPDDLKVLQQIANSVVQELRRAGLTADDTEVHLRLRVGRKVFKYAGNDILNVDGIRRAVLASFRN